MVRFVRNHPYRLTPLEQVIAALLCERGRMSKPDIMAALYPNLKAPPGKKIVDVVVCRIRRKLGPAGIEIVTDWGVGYEMPDESRAALRRINEVCA